MKHLVLLLLLMLPLITVAQRCQNPMPANMFRQKLNQLAMQPNDQQKLQFSKNQLQGACLLSSQVKDLAMVFHGDYYRFEFCKRAFKQTFDPDNFYDVYDAFGSLSSAMRLYDFVSNHNRALPPLTGPHPPGSHPHQTWYPDLGYPLTGGYKGVVGCQLPLADRDFEVLAMPVVTQKTDHARRTEALKLMSTNCLSLGQTMKIATLFELESNRLGFLKEQFTKLYDMGNYQYATEVFSHMPYKNEWLSWCNSMITPTEPEPPAVICEITDEEFNTIKKSISNVSVNSTRLNLARQVISTKKCFSVKQIGAIMNLFSVESSRLDIALFSYDYCTNTADYYRLTENLSTTSSKNTLLEFIGKK